MMRITVISKKGMLMRLKQDKPQFQGRSASVEIQSLAKLAVLETHSPQGKAVLVAVTQGMRVVDHPADLEEFFVTSLL